MQSQYAVLIWLFEPAVAGYGYRLLCAEVPHLTFRAFSKVLGSSSATSMRRMSKLLWWNRANIEERSKVEVHSILGSHWVEVHEPVKENFGILVRNRKEDLGRPILVEILQLIIVLNINGEAL